MFSRSLPLASANGPYNTRFSALAAHCAGAFGLKPFVLYSLFPPERFATTMIFFSDKLHQTDLNSIRQLNLVLSLNLRSLWLCVKNRLLLPPVPSCFNMNKL
jgi:hypothetical protein